VNPTVTAEAPALMALASDPPVFPAEEARRTALALYGLDAPAEPKSSERDRNFRINAGPGADIVLKVCNRNEDPAVIAFQIAGLRHVAAVDPDLPVPRVVPTLGGAATSWVASDAGETLLAYALTYRPGEPLWDIAMTADLMRAIGRAVARLGVALKTFAWPAPQQALVWDVRRAEAMRAHVPLIADPEGRLLVSAALDRFRDHTMPAFAQLRHQVIHNDANRGNVLVDPTLADPVTGLVDFGDMVFAPLVLDVSTAAMELAAPYADPIGLVAAFLEGYAAVTPLTPEEIACIYDAMMTRLAVCVAVYAWRGANNAEPRQDAGRAVERFIQEMRNVEAVGRDAATARFHAVCGRG